jgi:hypothetical protein
VTPPGFAADALSAAKLAAPYFLTPLALTLVVEVPIVAAIGRFQPRAVVAGVLANTLTNPAAVLVVMALPALGVPLLVWPFILLLLEATIVLTEARVYSSVLGWDVETALVTSVAANILSLGVGIGMFLIVYF